MSDEDRRDRDKYSEAGQTIQFAEWERMRRDGEKYNIPGGTSIDMTDELLKDLKNTFIEEKSFHETKMRQNLNYVDVTPLHIPENNIYSVFGNNYELVAIGVHLNSNKSNKKNINGRELQVQVAAGGHYIAEVKRKVRGKDYYFTVSDSSVHRLGRDETPFDINNRTWQRINTSNPKIVYVLLKKVDDGVEITSEIVSV